MKNLFKALEQSLRRKFKVKIIKKERFKELIKAEENFKFLSKLSPEAVGPALNLISTSPSQLYQDIFVLSELGFKKNGFFVEFGAANGYNLSNSWLLEAHFGWKGILSEPARCWNDSLSRNRKCIIDNRCVWSRSGEQLEFSESAEISTITGFGEDDPHKKARQGASKYKVHTVTLMELMDEYSAPINPDYLSIDTEGSEYEILKDFDFKKYQFKVITCEHNFTPMRDKLYKLLTKNGYVRKYEQLSKFDDWYVLE